MEEVAEQERNKYEYYIFIPGKLPGIKAGNRGNLSKTGAGKEGAGK